MGGRERERGNVFLEGVKETLSLVCALGFCDLVSVCFTCTLIYIYMYIYMYMYGIWPSHIQYMYTYMYRYVHVIMYIEVAFSSFKRMP